MRMIAFVPNKTGKNGVDALEDYQIFKDFQSVGLPVLHRENGFKVVEDNYSPSYPRLVALTESGEFAGVLNLLKPSSLPTEVMGVRVQPKFLGRGVGFVLYQTALKKYRVLCSSSDLSQGSSALWKKLIDTFGGNLCFSRGGKIVRVSIVGWDRVAGYTYPFVINQSGDRVSLWKLLRSKNESEKDAAENSFYEVKW